MCYCAPHHHMRLRLMSLLLPLLLSAALALAAGGNTSPWGADNRLQVLGYTDSEGRHYPRGPPSVPVEYHYPDNEVSNQIRHSGSSSSAYNPRTSLRHRGQHQDKQGHLHQGRTRTRKHHNFQQQAIGTMDPKPSGTPAVLRTSQWGTARIPHRGATVNVPALESTRKTIRGTVGSTVHTPPQTPWPRALSWHDDILQDEPSKPSCSPCIRCPRDRAVIANRGREMVLVEQPELRECHNNPCTKLPELRIEWIHGPKPGTLAEEGKHVMLGRVMYRHKQLKVCQMKYNVIVRKCRPLLLPKYMLAQCSMGNIWGSRCQLSCHQGFQLQGQNTIECTDTLEWSNALPLCESVSGCPLPMSPTHGRLSCKTATGGETYLLPENSVCRYVCNAGYAIPESQTHLAVISCQSGGWNSTVDPICQKENDKDNIKPEVVLKDAKHRTPRRRHKEHRLRSAHRISNDPCQPNPCHEGGTCLHGPRTASPICLCQDHREGEFCERSRCKAETCQNGGKCIMFGQQSVCYCPPGYSGQECQIQNSR